MTSKIQDMMCEAPAVERPRYFPRQLITPEDMIMEQDYFRNRMRMHNRLLHGWGVVCGALVAPVPTKNGNGGIEPWKVRVCPGYVLGPYGDDIYIACEHEVDLRKGSVTGTAADPCGTMKDPWCSEVWIEREPTEKYYIAVKYKEMAVRPVRVQPMGCGCEESRCEDSRLRDGYEIGVLTEIEYAQIKNARRQSQKWTKLFEQGTHNPSCIPCPPYPWVVLTCVQIDEETYQPKMIDNCTPRRLVAALGTFFWKCEGEVKIGSIDIDKAGTFNCEDQSDPLSLNPGDSFSITVKGKGFQDNLNLNLGAGIMVMSDTFTKGDNWPNDFKIEVEVRETAKEGFRDVIVQNPDCSTAFCHGAINIIPPTTTEVATGKGAPTKSQPVKKQPEKKKEDNETGTKGKTKKG